MNYSYDTHLQSTIDKIINGTFNILCCLYRMVIQPFKTFLGTQITNKQVSNAFQVGLLKKLSKSMFSFRGKFEQQMSRTRKQKSLGVSRQDTCLKDYITDNKWHLQTIQQAIHMYNVKSLRRHASIAINRPLISFVT